MSRLCEIRWFVGLTLLVMPMQLNVVRARNADYETIRLFTSSSRPEKIRAHAVAPNGRYLALSFDTSQTGSSSGISIVDLEQMRLLGRRGSFSVGTLAFSTDSTRVLGIGGYAGVEQLDLRTGTIRNVAGSPWVHDSSSRRRQSHLGFDVVETNGKLIVSQVLEAFHDANSIQVGDELVAFNDGLKATRYNDSREWRSLLGKTREEAIWIVEGRPTTWLQLRLQRAGELEPIDVVMQRHPIGAKAFELPTSGCSMAIALLGPNIVFYSADTNSECAALTLRDTSEEGLGAISPDGKLFAWVSEIVGGDDLCVEVYSLATGQVQTSKLLEKPTYRSICFSPDAKQVLVGTRDTVEILDLEGETWQEALSLTPPDERDTGQIVNRRVPLGLGFPGDLYTSFSTVEYSKPAALTKFDVSPGRVLAIGSELGDLTLVSSETKEVIGELGDKLLGAKAELVKFSPDGRHLVAYAKGLLHIFRFDDAGGNSRLRPTEHSPERISSGTITAMARNAE